MLTGARSNDDHNTFCYLYTQGRLPYGTCSSGRPEDERKTGAQMQIQDWPAVDVYALTHCTNGMWGIPPKSRLKNTSIKILENLIRLIADFKLGL